MQQYAIVYFPNINIDRINAFKEKYDPLWNIIRPHITLVSPFSDIPEEQIVQHLSTITKDKQPFQIHLRGLMKSFDDYLFLLVAEGKEEIISLHDILCSGILASFLRKDIPFIPHITLGVFRTKENPFGKEIFSKAYAEAETMNIDVNCTFDNLSLITGNGIIPSKIIRVFDFK